MKPVMQIRKSWKGLVMSFDENYRSPTMTRKNKQTISEKKKVSAGRQIAGRLPHYLQKIVLTNQMSFENLTIGGVGS